MLRLLCQPYSDSNGHTFYQSLLRAENVNISSVKHFLFCLKAFLQFVFGFVLFKTRFLILCICTTRMCSSCRPSNEINKKKSKTATNSLTSYPGCPPSFCILDLKLFFYILILFFHNDLDANFSKKQIFLGAYLRVYVFTCWQVKPSIYCKSSRFKTDGFLKKNFSKKKNLEGFVLHFCGIYSLKNHISKKTVLGPFLTLETMRYQIVSIYNNCPKS